MVAGKFGVDSLSKFDYDFEQELLMEPLNRIKAPFDLAMSVGYLFQRDDERETASSTNLRLEVNVPAKFLDDHLRNV